MARLALAFVFLASIVVASPSRVLAGSDGPASFSYHIGDAFQQGFGFPAGDQASAPNGDTVKVIGTGTFDVAMKAARGGGTFTHFAPDGSVRGAAHWNATRLVDFQFYGCGGPQLPDSFCGGRANIAIDISPDAAPGTHIDGFVEIECLIGKFPAGAFEGIRLNIPGLIHFNKPIMESGVTLFIRTS